MKTKFNIILSCLIFICANVFSQPVILNKAEISDGVLKQFITKVLETEGTEHMDILHGYIKLQDENNKEYVFETENDFNEGFIKYLGQNVTYKHEGDNKDKYNVCYNKEDEEKYEENLKDSKKKGEYREFENKIAVLGHYPRYIRKGAIYSALIFNVDKLSWDYLLKKNILRGDPDDKITGINKEFLRYIAQTNHVVILSDDFYAIKNNENSGLAGELDWLVSNGYSPSEDGCKMIRHNQTLKGIN